MRTRCTARLFSTLGIPLDPLTPYACAFFDDHGLYAEFGGVANDVEEGKRIAESLGDHKAAIPQNHGLITVGKSMAEAVWWFVSMDRACQAQLLAMAAELGLIRPSGGRVGGGLAHDEGILTRRREPRELAEIPNHRQAAQNLAKEPLPNRRHSRSVGSSGQPKCDRKSFVQFDHGRGGERSRRPARGDLVVEELDEVIRQDRTNERIRGPERDGCRYTGLRCCGHACGEDRV